MEDLKCPECGGPMEFVSGPIDDECRTPDFVYCKDCGRFGYDPETMEPVVRLYLAISAKMAYE